MTSREEDEATFQKAMALPQNHDELSRVQAMLDEDIARNHFNRDRANQVFLFAIDNCIYRYFSALGLGSEGRRLFPRETREYFAKVLLQRFLNQRGDIQSQRATRSGLLALLFGK